MLRVAYFYERVFREKLGLTEDEDIGDHRGPLVDLLGLMQHLDDCARVVSTLLPFLLDMTLIWQISYKSKHFSFLDSFCDAK